MRNSNLKNQVTSPSADSETTRKKEFVPVFNEWPESLFKQPAPKTQHIKATLFHLDGKLSEISLIVPFYTRWSEPYEEAAMCLKEYIYRLNQYFVQIERFKIEVGSLVDGIFVPGSIRYNPHEIPLDMVYVRGEKGKWVTKEEAMKNKYNNEGGSPC